MARPRKDPQEKRVHVMRLRLTDAELQRLKNEACRVNMSPYAYARIKMIGQEAKLRQVFELPPDLVFEVGRCGVNLNQIARRLNMSGEYEPEQLAFACERLEELINIVLSDIIYPD